jgi:hypothetical protein
MFKEDEVYFSQFEGEIEMASSKHDIPNFTVSLLLFMKQLRKLMNIYRFSKSGKVSLTPYQEQLQVQIARFFFSFHITIFFFFLCCREKQPLIVLRKKTADINVQRKASQLRTG